MAESDLSRMGHFSQVAYTSDNLAIWQKTISSRLKFMAEHGEKTVVLAVQVLEISPDRMPNFDTLDRIFFENTGWRVLEVDGVLYDPDIHRLLSRKIRPLFRRLRPDPENSIVWPDLIHDLFHLFPLFDPTYSAFICELGRLYTNAHERGDHKMTEALRSVAWHFVEYGIMQTQDGPKSFAPILNENPEGQFVMANPHLIQHKTIAEVARTPMPWLEDSNYETGQPMKFYASTRSYQELLEGLKHAGGE